jgi:hypothetical protein
VAQALLGVDARLTFHDFRMVRGVGHTNLIFDVAVPADIAKEEKAIKKAIKDALAANHTDTTYYTVITFDSQAFN